MGAVQSRGNGSQRAGEDFGDFIVGEAFRISQHDYHAQIGREVLDCRLHPLAHFAAKDFPKIVYGGLQYGKEFIGNGDNAPGAALVVHTAVHYQAIHPCFEAGIASKIPNGGEQLQECVLRDIHGQRGVAGESEGDGVDLVFVRFEKVAKGITFSALTRCDEFAI